MLYGRAPSSARSRSGLVERANGGTLVLESIEQIPEHALARLVSLLDNRSFYTLGAERPQAVDIRVIATSLDTDGEDTGSSIASALRSRLSGVTITLPTLVERQQDVPVFFREFLRHYERELEREADELNEAQMRHLLTHDWPGNLRELQMYAQNFVLGLTQIATSGPTVEEHPSLRDLLAGYEKSVLEDALRQAGGSVAQVQQHLDLPRKTLYDKLARYGIKPAEFRQ
ncbi:sigma-54-dependent transcriptional regulator [Aurantiacibacter gilvus]|uniref:Sigma 54-interacting transcriptional regulator n=1 Tax=Aurantiacibacter gilvus TaxID=3139141 RepID=A0ABU9ICP7_9SPHN